MHPITRARIRSRLVSGLAVAALALPLAACGDSDKDAAPSSPSGSSPSGSASDEPTPTAGGSATPAAGDGPVVLTPPGTRLSIDEAADVPLVFGAARAKARIEILDLEDREPADLPPDLRPAAPARWDLTFVQLGVTLLEGHGASVMNISAGMNIEGESKGDSVLPMILWEEFKPCYDAPPPFGPKGVRHGASWKACVPILTEKGEPLDAILFTNPNNRYRDPIRWVI